MTGTQYGEVRRMLRAKWTCGTELLAAHIPRYSARLHEIREREPLMILLRRRCFNPVHQHQGVQYQWCLMTRPCCDRVSIVPAPGVTWWCPQHGYTSDPDKEGNDGH